MARNVLASAAIALEGVLFDGMTLATGGFGLWVLGLGPFPSTEAVDADAINAGTRVTAARNSVRRAQRRLQAGTWWI